MRNIRYVVIALICFIGLTSGALPFEGTKIIMSAANREAALAGQAIAEKGGNAVDCAVAIELVMAVTNPNFGALGSGGFALVSIAHKNGSKVHALDFRETAPAAMSPTYYLSKVKDASITGGASVGVPGLVAGLWALHQKYGHLKWSELFDRAIELAQNGFRMTGKVADATAGNYKRFNAESRTLFLDNGKPYAPGKLVRQPGLAKALSLIRDHGPSAFYTGSVAKDIVSAVKKSGGDMTMKDLADYRIEWREPMTTSYHGYTVYVMPLPSSGGMITIRALRLLDLSGIDKTPLLSTDEYQLMGEVLQRAFLDRADMGDPEFYKANLQKLISEKRMKNLARTIHLMYATSSKKLAGLMGVSWPKQKSAHATNHEKRQTSHLAVLDRDGNAVSMTFTLNGNFGSGVATDRFGIMLNDEMDDFTTHPGQANMFGLIQGKANEVQAGKRPLSSMSPTLVAKDGKVVMALGAPGGPRIISSVIQTLYRVLARNEDLERAVEAPRVHHQFLPDILYYDNDDRMSYDVVKGLKARRQHVEPGWQAHVFAVRNLNGVLQGVVDSRDEGLAAGF